MEGSEKKVDLEEAVRRFEEELKKRNEEWHKKENEILPLLEWVKEEFGFDDDMAHVLFKHDTPLLKFSFNEIGARIRALIDLFGSKEGFLKFAEAQSKIEDWYHTNYTRKNNILTLETHKVVGRFLFLKQFFNMNDSELREFLYQTPEWLFRSSVKLVENIQRLVESLNISLEEARTLALAYPSWAGNGYFKFMDRVTSLCDYFDVDKRRIADYILESPERGCWGAYRYREAGVNSVVLDKPWLMDCISNYKDYRYGGYKHFSTLVEVTEFIENTFGKVERVITRKHENEGVLKCLLIAPNEKYNYYKLVTLGSGYVTKEGEEKIDNDKLLRAIFGDKLPEQYEKDDHCELVYHLGEVTEWSLELASTLLLVMATEDYPYKSSKMLKTKELLWRVPPYTYKGEKSYEKSQLKFSHEQYDVKFQQMIVLSADEVRMILEQGIHKEIFNEQAIIKKIFGGQDGFEKALLDFSRTSSIKKK